MDSMDTQEPLVDPEVRAFVFSLVSALGGSSAADDGRYVLGDDALAVLKDIKRWLRLYDDKTNRLDVARLLAEANLVKGDLLEILASWPHDAPEGSFRSKVALLCVDLLTQLTWPLEKEEQFTTMHHFLHKPYLCAAQASYKRAMLQHDTCKIFRTVVRVGLPAMAQPRVERSRVEENIIKVVLYLIRNTTMITVPEGAPLEADDAEISRSATIDAFHRQDTFDFLLTIGSSVNDEYVEHDVELLDVLFHLFKGIDVDRLFMEKDELVSSNTQELQSLIGKERGMLAGYARFAPSRHNRFGTKSWLKREDGKFSTVFGQTAASNEQVALSEMDRSKKWRKPRQAAKKTPPEDTLTEFNYTVPLTASARRRLRDFVEAFLDSSFNPLFLSIRKSIEREVDRLMEYHRRQFFFLISFFLRAESARRRRQALDQKHQTENETESFGLVASVLNQETFVLLNRYMEEAQDGKKWHDLNGCMKCFTQILRTVQEMSESPIEEDQEISENTLNRIFYEQTTHDRISTLLRTYKDQGFGYLDACTELSHVFVRSLERYSKTNVDLQVRSLRRQRKKAQATEGLNGGEAAADDRANESIDRLAAQRTSTERRFDFNRFAAKFVNQASIDTFVAFTKFFRDLNPEQIKRAHRFFYRAAFKMDLAVYLFRMDVILLFNKMIKGPDGMDIDEPTYKEWEELVRQVFRKLVKRMESRPALAVEILFSKIPSTIFYLEHGFDREIPTKIPRAPAELEVKSSIPKDDQIGVAVSILINQSKSDLLKWSKDILSSAASERKSWEEASIAQKSIEASASVQQENQNAAKREQNRPSQAEGEAHVSQQVESQKEDQPNEVQKETAQETSRPPSIIIRAPTKEHRQSLDRDKYLRLLFSLLSFQRLYDPTALDEGSDQNAPWIVPSYLDSATLSHSQEQISKFEFSPPSYEEGKSAEDLVRNKPTATAIAAREERELVRAQKAKSRRESKKGRSEGSNADSEGDSSDAGSDCSKGSASGSEESAKETDNSEGELDPNLTHHQSLFPPGGPNVNSNPTKTHNKARKSKKYRHRHKRDKLLDPKTLEERHKARKRSDRDRALKVKSSLYISKSDDESDEERDREFFEREERVRREAGERTLRTMREEARARNEKRLRKGKRNKGVADRASEDYWGSEEGEHDSARSKRRRTDPKGASADEGVEVSPQPRSMASSPATASLVAQTEQYLRSHPRDDDAGFANIDEELASPPAPASEVSTDAEGDGAEESTPPSSQRPSSGHGPKDGPRSDVEMSEAADGGSDKENAGSGGVVGRRRGRVTVVESDDED